MTAASVPHYDFLAPSKILFGWGRWTEIAPVAAALGRRAFVVAGSRTLQAAGFIEELQQKLAGHGVRAELLATISREPEVPDVDEAAERLRSAGAGDGDLVIGVGGGSAIDLAKAVAAMAVQPGAASVKEYLEGVGSGLKIKARPLPMVAMPTTAGTGSEATKNAVLSSFDPPFKKSLRSDWMMPRAVVIDPELATSVSPAVTAHTGMDAITQLIESYISRKARPIPRALAADGLRLALGAIELAVADGSSRPAREAMAQAALYSGMALANSGLGMAHGVAAALGSHAHVAHGLACAMMLPATLRTNLPMCEHELGTLARAVGVAGDNASDGAAAEALIARIEAIEQRIGIPRRLSDVGVTRDQLPALVRDSRGNSMDGNPRSLSDAELTTILEGLL